MPNNIDNIKNGKGTGNPGSGMQAFLTVFITYPVLHSISFGIHPSPASFNVNPEGQISPTSLH